MRVFGWLAYVHNKKGVDRFDKRGKPGIFLRYPGGKKVHKIFYLVSKKYIL